MHALRNIKYVSAKIKHSLLACLLMLSSLMSVAQDFITVWQLLPGETSLTFNAERAATGVAYNWETIPAGSSGSGTLIAGTDDVTITGLPAGANIRLRLAPTNLKWFRSLDWNTWVGDDQGRLRDVEAWGTASWTSMESAFYYAFELDISATDIPNLSAVSSTQAMFSDCYSLTGPSNIGSWNTSAITNMNSMFSYAQAFNQNIDGWNTSVVTDMSYMFSGTNAFNANITGWNTAGVTNMSGMFSYNTTFNQNISSWNTAAVTNMSYMFYYNTSFNQNISSWNTSAVNNMSSMFQNASAFNQCLGSWMLNPGVNLTNMFNACGMDKLSYSATLAGWYQGNPTVTGRSLGASGRTYNYYVQLNHRTELILPVGSGGRGWTISGDTPSLDHPTEMTCSGSEFVSQWYFSSASSSVTFNALTAGGSVNYSWQCLPSGNSGSGSFTQSTAGSVTLSGLTINAGDRLILTMSSNNLRRFYIANGTDKDKLTRIWQWGNVPWSSMEDAFYGCTNLNIYSNNIPDLSNTTSMARMFKDCSLLNGPLNIGNWNTSVVNNMNNLFENATSFNLSLENWDISAVTSLNDMLNNSGMDCYHYSATLVGWNANPSTPNGLNLGATGLYYNNIAVSARSNLISIKGWTITDNGLGVSCGYFITKWTFSSAPTSLAFNALTAGGAVNYTWSASPSGASGSGSFTQATPGAVSLSLTGVAAGDVLTLSLEPANLRRFYINNGVDRLNLSGVTQWERPLGQACLVLFMVVKT